jgi:integrase
MPTKRKPSYLLHKPTGQARCRIDGKDNYLGEYGSPESRDRYDDLIADWFACNGDTTRFQLMVDDLALLYTKHVREHYRKDGEPTSEVACIRLALRHLVKAKGRVRARNFGPKALKEVRQSMIDAGYVRTSINIHVGRIKRLFRWAVENEFLPVEVYQTICTVQGLRKGRSKAKESHPVEPVGEETVNKTLPHLSSPVAAMVKLQLLIGARPSEVAILRPCDITKSKGVWTYRPHSHKTEHRDRERRIFIGPKGQRVLRPYLHRDPGAYCFSPAEAEAERNAERRSNRKTPMTPSQRKRIPKKKRKRPPKERYTKDSYRRAVVRACLKAGVEPWSPNRLRHSRGTMIRGRFGIEAAQVVLGHSDCRTTEIYAERDFDMAARIMREIG